MMRTFKIILEKEMTGYSVLVPALHGCTTQGETLEECLKNAKEDGASRSILKGAGLSVDEFMRLL